MSHKIEIRLINDAGQVPWLDTIPLVDDDGYAIDITCLEDEELTELILGTVREHVTRELL